MVPLATVVFRPAGTLRERLGPVARRKVEQAVDARVTNPLQVS
jgi:hypothetical protein